MLKKTGWLSAGLTLAAFSAVVSFAPGRVSSAQAAVVYCKTAGVPQVGVARVGVGVGGVGVRPGTPLNRGGPVNRVGRR